MGLHLLHLDDPAVRDAMVRLWSEEWEELAQRSDRVECYGKPLTDAGWDAFGEAMPEALRVFDDEWLYQQMDQGEYWRTELHRRARGGGGWTVYAVNRPEALRRLCYGEFNIAYIRGLAHVLLERGETHGVVYRAADAVERRAECTSWEGTQVPLDQVLDGHRARYWPPPGNKGAWSIPTGVNCHHSIHAVGARDPLARH